MQIDFPQRRIGAHQARASRVHGHQRELHQGSAPAHRRQHWLGAAQRQIHVRLFVRAPLLRRNRRSRRRIRGRARRGNARDNLKRGIRSGFVVRRKKRSLPHFQQNRPHHERHAIRRRRQARPVDHRSRRRHPHRRRRLVFAIPHCSGGEPWHGFGYTGGWWVLVRCFSLPPRSRQPIASPFFTTPSAPIRRSRVTGVSPPSLSTTASASSSTPATTRKTSSTTSRPSTLTLPSSTSLLFLTVTPITLPGLSICSRSIHPTPSTSPPLPTPLLAS